MRYQVYRGFDAGWLHPKVAKFVLKLRYLGQLVIALDQLVRWRFRFAETGKLLFHDPQLTLMDAE